MLRSAVRPLPRLLPVFLAVLSCATAGAQPPAPGSAAAGAAAGATPPAAVGANFVWLSDIHLTPFYPYSYKNIVDEGQITAMLELLVDRSDPSAPVWKDHSEWAAVLTDETRAPLQAKQFSDRGKDANDKVFRTVLEHAATVAPSPGFVLITGDLLGHGFGYDYSHLAPAGMDSGAAYRSFVAETLGYIARTVRGYFPDPPIVATLGNNDAYCGDYDIHLPSPPADFLGDTAGTFLAYFLPDLEGDERQAFLDSFLQGGYYSHPVPGGDGSRILVLNSVALMGRYPEDDGSGSFPGETARQLCDASPTIDAGRQLEWLAREAAQPGRAWVAAHVPPGDGCYDDKPFWTADNLAAYRQLFLVGPPAANLAGTLSAHSHMASFKLLRGEDGRAESFVVQAPSISPNHSNNPTFGVVAHDPRTLEIRSHRIYYLDLDRAGAVWKHYQFAGLDGPTTAASLETLYGQLGGSSALWQTFAEDYGARAGSVVSLGRLAQDHLDCLNDLGSGGE